MSISLAKAQYISMKKVPKQPAMTVKKSGPDAKRNIVNRIGTEMREPNPQMTASTVGYLPRNLKPITEPVMTPSTPVNIVTIPKSADNLS